MLSLPKANNAECVRKVREIFPGPFLVSPLLFIAAIAVLVLTGLTMDPAVIDQFFDQSGYSPFELATIPVFAAIIPLVWWKCPFAGSTRRKVTLSLMVTVVVIMAIAKELDLHLAVIHWLYPDYVSESGSVASGMLYKPNGDMIGGTPFKSRVLFNAAAPFGMRAFIFAYFALFFGVFGVGFVYLLPSFFKGVFRLEPCAWAAGCFGASGVLVQITDRLPAWTEHILGEKAESLCTVLEEGGEMLLAAFALLTIYLGYRKLRHENKANCYGHL